jgi:hypothetical protein
MTDEADIKHDNLFLDTASNEDCELGVAKVNNSLTVAGSNIFTLEVCPLC